MKHLILFFFTLIPLIHCRKTYQLFAIPAFTLDLSLTSPIQWSTDQSLTTRSQIQESVEAFLFSSFEEYLNEMGSSTTAVNALDSVELDVTIYNKDSLTLTADLIGDVDPIKAATLKLPYSDERVIHFGLVPRSHRGLFVINELPDLQARIQVALFNILQEGDIQIRGFKLRRPSPTRDIYQF